MKIFVAFTLTASGPTFTILISTPTYCWPSGAAASPAGAYDSFTFLTCMLQPLGRPTTSPTLKGIGLYSWFGSSVEAVRGIDVDPEVLGEVVEVV